MQNASVYLSPELLGIAQLSASDLTEIAQNISRISVLPFLARMNVALETGGADDEDFQLRCFTPLISHYTAGSPVTNPTQLRLTIFTPHHFRLVIWLILTHGCSGTNSVLEDDQVGHNIGTLLLHSEQALSPSVRELKSSDPLWLPNLEISMRRGYRMSTRSLEDFSVKGYLLTRLMDRLSLHEVFYERYGFTHVQLQTALNALWLHFRNHGPRLVESNVGTGIGFSYLMGIVRAPKAVGDFILENMVLDLSESHLSSEEQFANLSMIANRPLAYWQGVVICLDLDYLAAKAARTLWNLTNATAQAKRIGAFTGEMGGVFEEYCNTILTATCRARGRQNAWMAPKSLLGETADGFYVEGEVAVVFEFKSAPMGYSAIYTTDPQVLADEINRKYIVGSDGDPQGFIQCANHLEFIAARKEEFRLKGVKYVVPCVVMMDDIMTWAPCYEFATQRAKELFQRFDGRSFKVSNPIILHSEDLGLLAERACLASIPRMMLRIARVRLSMDLCTKNLITRLWPQDIVDEVQSEKFVVRPTDFLDMSIEYLGDTEEPGKPCSACGSSCKLFSSNDGAIYWCDNCQESVYATDEEVRQELDRIEATARRYEIQDYDSSYDVDGSP
ncbi:MAG: hypothetical protein JST35_05005 [Armatimonadetes bacterium]|nr:hypothetical protein [Armatimonadota bacterium]